MLIFKRVIFALISALTLTKNIILEGLTENRREDVYETVIRTVQELGIRIYDNDINLAYRIGTYKGEDVWPRPIRVELISTHVRDIIWQNRRRLEESLSHYNVRISKDETKAVRKAKAVLRKAANKARNQGKTVYQHEDYILIDGHKYDIQNADGLEEKPTYATIAAGKKNVVQSTDEKERARIAKNARLPAERKTKAGLAFFTVESKRSCFYPVPVVFEGVEYETPEHNYQCLKALTSEMMDLYHQIKEAPTPRRAKQLGGNVPYNPVWEKMKPGIMFRIQLAKHEQHPELGDELCEIKGTFMEASLDDYWGTGVTIMDPSLETGEFTGRNELGKSLNKVKDTLLARKAVMGTAQIPMQLDHEHLAPHTTRAGVTTYTQPGPISMHDPMEPTTSIVQELPAREKQGENRATESREAEAHSMEIEVLEVGIDTTKKRPSQALEPQIIFKEGTIVV